MQRGIVYYNGMEAGIIERRDDGSYVFEYADAYCKDTQLPSISLTLPKREKRFESKELFPFFYGLLMEGINKDMQCRALKIDEQDDFTRLLKTSGDDTIGAITIREA